MGDDNGNGCEDDDDDDDDEDDCNNNDGDDECIAVSLSRDQSKQSVWTFIR